MSARGQLALFGDGRADGWARFVEQQNRWAKEKAARVARMEAHWAAAGGEGIVYHCRCRSEFRSRARYDEHRAGCGA